MIVAAVPILADPARLDRYIAASQIGITLSSLILGAYGQSALAPRVRPLFQGFGRMEEVAADDARGAAVLIHGQRCGGVCGDNDRCREAMTSFLRICISKCVATE